MSPLTRFAGVLMVVNFCAGSAVETAQAQTTDEVADAIVAAMDKQPDMAEARKWLTDEKTHLVGPNSKMKRADIKKLIDDLYAAGAPRVYFVSIQKDAGNETSQLLTIILPSTGPARAKIGAVQDAFYKAYLPTVGLGDLAEGLKFTDAMQPVHPVNLAF